MSITAKSVIQISTAKITFLGRLLCSRAGLDPGRIPRREARTHPYSVLCKLGVQDDGEGEKEPVKFQSQKNIQTTTTKHVHKEKLGGKALGE